MDHTDEPTVTIYVRVPQSVNRALRKRCKRDRRSLAGGVTVILEEGLIASGDLARLEPEEAAV